MHWIKKAILILGYGGLIGYFGWLFYEITLFTENFDILNIISNDETIFHYVLREQRGFMERGEWALFFTQTHAVYGNWYWTLLLFLTHPFYALDIDSLVIMIPRMMSWVSAIWCLFLMDYILRSKKIEHSLRVLTLILPTTCVGLLITMTPFHTNLPLAAILMSSFALMWNMPRDQFPWLAVVLYGLALGLKLPAVLYYPFFCILLGWNIKYQVRAFLIIVLVAIFSFSPLVIFYPLGLKEASRCIEEMQLILSWNSQVHPETQSFFSYLYNGFIFYQYHWIILTIPFIWIMKDLRNKKWREPLLYSSCLLAALLIAARLKTDLYFMTYYTTTGIFLIPLFLLRAVDGSWFRHAIIFALVALNLAVDRVVLTNRLVEVYRLRYSRDTVFSYQDYQHLKTVINVQSNDRPMIDRLMAFPAGAVKSGRPLQYYYSKDNPQDDVWKDSNLFAFHHLSEGWTKGCGELSKPENKEACYFIDKLKQIHKEPTVIFSSNRALVLQIK